MNSRHWSRAIRCGALCAIVCGLLPLAVSSQDAEPKPLKKILPAYPEVFKGRGIYGTVHLKVLVDADGSVKSVEVMGGNPIFSEAAAKAVKQWRYPAAGRERTATIAVEFECCYVVKTIP